MGNPFAKMGPGIRATGGKGDYFEYQPDKTRANYKVRLREFMYLDGQGGQYFIAKFENIQSDCTKPDGSLRFRRGSPLDQVIKLGGQYETTALGNVKGVVLAAITSAAEERGEDRPSPDNIDGDMIMAMCSDAQPLKGVELFAQVTHKLTKKKESDFTVISYIQPSEVNEDTFFAAPSSPPVDGPTDPEPPASEGAGNLFG